MSETNGKNDEGSGIPALLELQYHALLTKQQAHNTLVWNSPILFFAAETFLWTIAFDNAICNVVRVGVSIFSLLIALVSWQHFERNRLMEIADSTQLEFLENAILKLSHKEPAYPLISVHQNLKNRGIRVGRDKKVEEGKLESECLEKIGCRFAQFLAARRTFPFWRAVFFLFSLAAILIFVYNVCLSIRYGIFVTCTTQA